MKEYKEYVDRAHEMIMRTLMDLRRNNDNYLEIIISPRKLFDSDVPMLGLLKWFPIKICFIRHKDNTITCKALCHGSLCVINACSFITDDKWIHLPKVCKEIISSLNEIINLSAPAPAKKTNNGTHFTKDALIEFDVSNRNHIRHEFPRSVRVKHFDDIASMMNLCRHQSMITPDFEVDIDVENLFSIDRIAKVFGIDLPADEDDKSESSETIKCLNRGIEITDPVTVYNCGKVAKVIVEDLGFESNEVCATTSGGDKFTFKYNDITGEISILVNNGCIIKTSRGELTFDNCFDDRLDAIGKRHNMPEVYMKLLHAFAAVAKTKYHKHILHVSMMQAVVEASSNKIVKSEYLPCVSPENIARFILTYITHDMTCRYIMTIDDQNKLIIERNNPSKSITFKINGKLILKLGDTICKSKFKYYIEQLRSVCFDDGVRMTIIDALRCVFDEDATPVPHISVPSYGDLNDVTNFIERNCGSLSQVDREALINGTVEKLYKHKSAIILNVCGYRVEMQFDGQDGHACYSNDIMSKEVVFTPGNNTTVTENLRLLVKEFSDSTDIDKLVREIVWAYIHKLEG